MTVLGIDHVVLRCRDLSAMLTFYTTVLGCQLERSVEEIGLYQLRAGNSLIDIVPIGRPLGGELEPQQPYHNVDHFCLEIEPTDLSNLCEKLEAAGLSPSSPARRYGASGFGDSVYIQDPQGNTVELKPST